jgi:hypothetical protein
MGGGYSKRAIDTDKIGVELKVDCAKDSVTESSVTFAAPDSITLPATDRASKASLEARVKCEPALPLLVPAQTENMISNPPCKNCADISTYMTVILAVETLEFLTWQEIGRVCFVGRKWRERLSHKDVIWWSLCRALARDRGLFVPDVYAPGWRQMFFEHLYPARTKWDEMQTDRLSGSGDFKIQVAVRLKAGRQSKRQFLLPLHQRLRLLKKGEVWIQVVIAFTVGFHFFFFGRYSMQSRNAKGWSSMELRLEYWRARNRSFRQNFSMPW